MIPIVLPTLKHQRLENERQNTMTTQTEQGIGHNSEPPAAFAKDQLRAIIERIERLEVEKKATADDIKDVYTEAKGNGLDAKAIRTIIRMRKQDAGDRAEQETILDLYMHALGMI